jgi:opacity protein-like surface antigen
MQSASFPGEVATTLLPSLVRAMSRKKGERMKAMKRVILATALCGCGVPMNAALAQAEPGIYAGFFFGTTDSDGSPSGASQAGFDAFGIVPTGPITSSEDPKDSGYGFQVGYRFNRWLALEGGYVDLGDTTFRASTPAMLDGVPDSADTFTQKLTSNIAGLTASVLGIVPINFRWELYGRAGLLIGNDELDVRASNSVGSASFDVSESATDTVVGAGVAFFLAEIYSVRAEYTRILDAGDEISGENDIDMLSLGLTVRF